MARSNQVNDAQSALVWTSLCVAPGFNPGRCSETNQHPETSNRPAQVVPEFFDRNAMNDHGFNPGHVYKTNRRRQLWAKIRITSRQLTNATAKIRIASRQLTNARPKIRIASHQLTNATPKIFTASRHSENARPKIRIASRQLTNARPKTRIASRQLTNATPKIRITFYHTKVPFADLRVFRNTDDGPLCIVTSRPNRFSTPTCIPFVVAFHCGTKPLRDAFFPTQASASPNVRRGDIRNPRAA